MAYVHRLVLEVKMGRQFAAGEVSRHECDNPLCVNPDHLMPGTRADNVADMMARGRHGGGGVRGEDHPFAKLSESDVLAIRSDPRTNRAIAAEYGIDRSTAGDIKRRKIWRHV